MYFPIQTGYKLNITSAIVHFYILEEMSIQSPSLFLMQRKKWNDLIFDINLVYEELTEKLARVLFDYLCLSSLGEARHAKTQCRYFFIDNFHSNLHCRETVYESGPRYNPVQFLPILQRLFFKGGWFGGGYGGVKWGNIVNAALLYQKIPDKIFVDHIIDLCHNGGTAFDKNILLFLNGKCHLTTILNAKCECNSFIEYLTATSTYVELTPLIIRLINRMTEFNPLFDVSKINHLKTSIIFPEPIQWEKEYLFLKEKDNRDPEEKDPYSAFKVKSVIYENSGFTQNLEYLFSSTKFAIKELKKKIEKIENMTEEEIKTEEESSKKVKIKIKNPVEKAVETILDEPNEDLLKQAKEILKKHVNKSVNKTVKNMYISDYLDKIIKEKEEKESDSNSKAREE